MPGLNSSETQLLLTKVREIDAFRNYGVSYSMEGISEVIAPPIAPITAGIMFYSTDTQQYYAPRHAEPQQLPPQSPGMGSRGVSVVLNCGGAAIAWAATGASGGTLAPLALFAGGAASLQCGMSIGRVWNLYRGVDDSMFDSQAANWFNYALEFLGWVAGIGEIKAVIKSATLATRYPLIRRMVVSTELRQVVGTSQRETIRTFLNGLSRAERQALAAELRRLSQSTNPNDTFKALISSSAFRRQINNLSRGVSGSGSVRVLGNLETYVRGKIRDLSLSISGLFVSTVGSTQGGIAEGIAGGILRLIAPNRTLYVYFYDTESNS